MNYKITKHAKERAKERFEFSGSPYHFICSNIGKSFTVNRNDLACVGFHVSRGRSSESERFLVTEDGFVGVVKNGTLVTVTTLDLAKAKSLIQFIKVRKGKDTIYGLQFSNCSKNKEHYTY